MVAAKATADVSAELKVPVTELPPLVEWAVSLLVPVVVIVLVWLVSVSVDEELLAPTVAAV
jgi:hypothetical protein